MWKYVAYRDGFRTPYREEKHGTWGAHSVYDAIYLGSDRQLRDFLLRADIADWTIRNVGTKVVENGSVIL